MKKVILMAAIMLSSVSAFAQNAVGTISIQPKVGLNIADLTKLNDSDPRVGFAVGVEGEYQVTDLFSITAGALYSMQGAKGQDVISNTLVKETMKLDYINIPILANVYVAKGLAVKLGIQPGFNVTAKAEAKAGGVKVEEDIDINTFDFSIPVGISYDYKNVVLDARYNWGMTKVVDGADSKNSVFQITLGYKFAL